VQLGLVSRFQKNVPFARSVLNTGVSSFVPGKNGATKTVLRVEEGGNFRSLGNSVREGLAVNCTQRFHSGVECWVFTLPNTVASSKHLLRP
jgi:hypothetical protein